MSETRPLLFRLCKLSTLSTLSLFADWSRPLLFNFFVSRNVKTSGLPLQEAAFQMDCVSLAVMTLNIVAFATAYGFNGGVDAYAPIAYGEQKHAELHLILYRQLILLAILCTALMTLLWNAESLLMLCGQPAAMAQRTGQLLFYMSFSVPGDLAYDCLGHWARSQQRQSVVTACAAVGLCINLVVNIFFANPSLPFMSPIIAVVLQNTVLPLLLSIGLWQNSKVIRAPVKAIVENIGPQLCTGLAQMCWTCAELWAWEVQVFEARALGIGGAASYALISSTYSFLIMVPCGVCSGMISLLGEALGMKDFAFAQRILFTGIAYAVFLVICYGVPLSLFRHAYAEMISGGVPVVETRVKDVVPIIMLTHLGDAGFNMLKSWLTVRQHQLFGAMQSLVVYYFAGLPLGYLLAFQRGLDVAGLWVGLSAAVVLGTLACLVRTCWDLRKMQT